jgi:glycosyltransferase involved in cell wall biosynthesis
VTLTVGLNALHLVPGETGGSELYARRLVGALAALEDSLSIVVFAPNEAVASLAAEPWAENVEIVRVPVQARRRVRRVLAEQTLLRRAVARSGVELLHNLFTTAPALPGVPQVTTILDVIYKRFPETHGGAMSYGMRLLVPLAARRSRRVLTLSQASKDDIVRFLHVPADRVDVTYLGPALQEDETVSEDDVRRRLELGGAPIVLTVSAKRPHKNLERLFEAFSGVRAQPEAVLVVPGYPTFHEPELQARADALGVGHRIRFTGWLDDEVLDGLYHAASCFVFPSLAEGFGLPVLDALVRGTPTACSNASSLPEVGGDAVLYFDPTDVGAIARAIARLLQDSALRERLRLVGPERARMFTWEQTARATVESYRRAESDEVDAC